MNSHEYDMALKAAEELLEDLRVRYEKYFRGVDRVQPEKAHTAFERVFRELKKNPPRNTALRFRTQQLQARFITHQQYWKRICRQIEEGTYARDVRRAQERRAREAVASPGQRFDLGDAFEMDLDAEINAALDGLLSDDLFGESAAPNEAPTKASFAAPGTGVHSVSLDAPFEPELLGSSRTGKLLPLPEVRLPAEEHSEQQARRALSTAPPLRRSWLVQPSSATRPPSTVAPSHSTTAPKAPEPTTAPAASVGAPKQPPTSAPKPPPPSARLEGGREPSGPRPPSATLTGGRPVPRPPAEPKAPPRPAERPAPAPPTDQGMRQLYDQYIAARRTNNQRVDNVNYESMVRSVEKIRAKHAGRELQFKVIVKDGKAAIKPVGS